MEEEEEVEEEEEEEEEIAGKYDDMVLGLGVEAAAGRSSVAPAKPFSSKPVRKAGGLNPEFGAPRR